MLSFPVNWEAVVMKMFKMINTMSLDMRALKAECRATRNAYKALAAGQGHGLVFSKTPSQLLGVDLPLQTAAQVAQVEKKLARSEELVTKVVSTLCAPSHDQ